MYRTRICCMAYALIYITGLPVVGQAMHQGLRSLRLRPIGVRNIERPCQD
jgi:hypothetical protein